jgi:hypothetical protein
MFTSVVFPRLGAAIPGLAAAFLLATSMSAHAGYPESVKSACKGDFKSFCPRYDIDSAALRQCMRSVANELSPRCVEALERSGEKRRK